MFQKSRFSSKLTQASEEFGQGSIVGDEEFLPDKEELELQLQEQMDATLTLATKSDD